MLINCFGCASGVKTLEEWKELLALEQSMEGILVEVHTYQSEKEVTSISIQSGRFATDGNSASGNDHVTQGKSVSVPDKSGSGTSTDRFPSGCYYCKKPGHIRAHCPKLLPNEKSVANCMSITADGVKTSVVPEPAIKQVMSTLGVQQYLASVYHPQREFFKGFSKP